MLMYRFYQWQVSLVLTYRKTWPYFNSCLHFSTFSKWDKKTSLSIYETGYITIKLHEYLLWRRAGVLSPPMAGTSPFGSVVTGSCRLKSADFPRYCPDEVGISPLWASLHDSCHQLPQASYLPDKEFRYLRTVHIVTLRLGGWCDHFCHTLYISAEFGLYHLSYYRVWHIVSENPHLGIISILSASIHLTSNRDYLLKTSLVQMFTLSHKFGCFCKQWELVFLVLWEKVKSLEERNNVINYGVKVINFKIMYIIYPSSNSSTSQMFFKLRKNIWFLLRNIEAKWNLPL